MIRVNKKEFKQRWMREKKELWKNKGMYGQFVREMPETTDQKVLAEKSCPES